MTENGRKILEHLEGFQNDTSLGFEENNCKYLQNETVLHIKLEKKYR
jgi:hypothetical protein